MESVRSVEDEVRALYLALLDGWNKQDADRFASLFTEDGGVVGFDGSPVDGRSAIQAHLHQIFADHRTARYVALVREVRFLGSEVALLRSAAGMIPPGQADINPAVNVIQSLVAVRLDGAWRIALFQNTPAQFHGRPEAAAALTGELRRLI